ncbi:MAG: hypothetical protein OEV42_18080 [Deltaproteobacteria bacterium]|nr:hypothetical protein [Deltaproteobacteria bacterium]
MKKRILMVAVVLFLSISVNVNAFEPINWPNEPVVAVLGASGSEAGTPVDSPFGGMAVAGGAYLALGHALIQENHRVQIAAQAGAYSYDVPGTGWLGYQSQYEKAVNQTMWIDGIDHLSAVFIDQMNDCMHSVPCSEEDMDIYIQRAVDVAVTARNAGKCVIVNALMPWESLDLPRGVAPYGISYTISESNYRLMADKHRTTFENLENIYYVEAYEGMTTFDGLHWDSASVKKGAHKISKVLKKECGF